MITQEHLNWFENLPKLWKKIFLCAIYHPKKVGADRRYKGYDEEYSEAMDIDDEVYDEFDEEFDDEFDEEHFVLRYHKTTLDSPEDLEKLFQITAIYFHREVNAEPDTVVDMIPPMHYFEQLEILSLPWNYVEDLSGLKGLKNLKSLCLLENLCEDSKQLGYIAELASLEKLDLSINSFDSMAPLKTLKNLKSLSFDWQLNKPYDLSPLTHLSNLESLECEAFYDLSPILSLKKLTYLSCGSNQCDFDLSSIESVLEQLPENCTGDIRLPSLFAKTSDETFLWTIILKDEVSPDQLNLSRLEALVEAKHPLAQRAMARILTPVTYHRNISVR